MLTRRFLPPRRFLGGGTKPKRSEALLYIEDSRQSTLSRIERLDGN